MLPKESKLEKLMEEAIILLRIVTKPEITSRLKSALETDDLKLAFHHSDGKKTKDIEELTGIKKRSNDKPLETMDKFGIWRDD